MDDRDDDSSDTLDSVVSEDPISDDVLDDFIRNFSEITELNYIRNPCVLQEIHQMRMNINMFINH